MAATNPTPPASQQADLSTDPGARFFRRAATFALLAPFLAIGLGSGLKIALAQSSSPASGQTGMLIGFFLVITAGAVMAVVSMFGMRKYGPQGILWKAVIGLALVGTLTMSYLGAALRPVAAPPAQAAPPAAR